MRVCDLEPGDALAVPEMGTGILICRHTPHPIYPSLCLVIWWLVEENRYSLDALDFYQELPGELVPADLFARKRNLQRALTPGAVSTDRSMVIKKTPGRNS